MVNGIFYQSVSCDGLYKSPINTGFSKIEKYVINLYIHFYLCNQNWAVVFNKSAGKHLDSMTTQSLEKLFY